MGDTTYIVDGQTLVNNIHFLKQCVYDGTVRIHIPSPACDTVENLHQKSLETRESPKSDKPKRSSGKARREQQPLFDINPRTTLELLARAKSESGIIGVTLQTAENETFTWWAAEQTKENPTVEKPHTPHSSFSEALLRKLNIKSFPAPAGDSSEKAGVVTNSKKSQHDQSKRDGIPTILQSSIPGDLLPFFSHVLWQIYEVNHDIQRSTAFKVLSDNARILEQAKTCQVDCCSIREFRHSQQTASSAATDLRTSKGELELEFPDVRSVDSAISKGKSVEHVNPKTGFEAPQGALEDGNPPINTVSPPTQDNALASSATLELSNSPIATTESRQIISYAMAAGGSSGSTSTSFATAQPTTTEEAQNEPVKSDTRLRDMQTGQDDESPGIADGETDSDEEVVVFNPKARQAAQASRKRRSNDLHHVEKKVTTHINSPGQSPGQQSPRPVTPGPASTALGSILNPDSPVFSPRQYTGPSPLTQQNAPLASPKLHPTDFGSALLKSSPPQRASTTSPRAKNKQASGGSRHQRKASASRAPNQDNGHRQSEAVLQRHREALKKSAQLQKSTADAGENEPSSKGQPIEVELRPTSNPVVIDPDDFGRDYTIKAGIEENSGSRGRGSANRKRGGRGRGGGNNGSGGGGGGSSGGSNGLGSKSQQQTAPKPVQAQPHQQLQQLQQQQQQQQPQVQRPDGAHGGDIEFVLKTGNPRGASRGKGKLWVP